MLRLIGLINVFVVKLTVAQLVSNTIFYKTWKFLYRVHNSPSLNRIQSQMNPFHMPIACFFKVHFNSMNCPSVCCKV